MRTITHEAGLSLLLALSMWFMGRQLFWATGALASLF
jgi:hypothetical protein